MGLARRARLATVLAALLVAGLAGALAACSSGGGSAPTSTASPTPVVYQIPELPVTLTAPSTWTQSTQDGNFLLRGPRPAPDPASTATGAASRFRPNVVITTALADTATLADEGARAQAQIAGLQNWTPDPQRQGMTHVGNAETYRIAGTYALDGVHIRQVVSIIEVGAGAERMFVAMTSSTQASDQVGAVAAQAIMDSLRVEPGGAATNP